MLRGFWYYFFIFSLMLYVFLCSNSDFILAFVYFLLLWQRLNRQETSIFRVFPFPQPFRSHWMQPKWLLYFLVLISPETICVFPYRMCSRPLLYFTCNWKILMMGLLAILQILFSYQIKKAILGFAIKLILCPDESLLWIKEYAVHSDACFRIKFLWRCIEGYREGLWVFRMAELWSGFILFDGEFNRSHLFIDQ